MKMLSIEESYEARLDALSMYMRWYIARLRVTTLRFRIENWGEWGYIEYGRSPSELPSFDHWLKAFRITYIVYKDNTPAYAVAYPVGMPFRK